MDNSLVASRSVWREPAVWLAPLCLGLLMALLVRACGVNVPFNDDFDSPGRVLFEWSQTRFSWQSLWQQHNESRLFIPRIIWLFEAITVGWSTKHWMYASVAICVSEATLLMTLLRQANATRWFLFLAGTCTSVLLLHPRFANGVFLRGSQAITLVPGLLIVLGLFLYTRRIGYAAKLAIYVALAEISTLTFASGMALWVLLFPVFPLLRALQDDAKPRSQVFAATSIAGCCAVMALVTYFLNFQKLAMDAKHSSPPGLLQYFLTWTGASLASIGHLNQSAIFGGCLCAAALLCVALLVLQARREKTLARIEEAWPWLILIAFVVISGAVNTIGRYKLGLENALAPRYFLITIQMAVGLAGLFSLLLGGRAAETARKHLRARFAVVAALLLAGVVYAVANWEGAIVENAAFRDAMLRRQLALSLWKEAPNISPLPILQTPPPRHRTHYLAIIQAGLCQDYSPVEWLRQALRDAQIKEPVGVVKVKGPAEKLIASGWAMNPVTRMPYPAVLTAIVRPDLELEPIAVDIMTQLGPRVPLRLDLEPSLLKMGFLTSLPSSRMVANSPDQLRFFVIDPVRRFAAPLRRLP